MASWRALFFFAGSTVRAPELTIQAIRRYRHHILYAELPAASFPFPAQ
jgi:hypothetical protein